MNDPTPTVAPEELQTGFRSAMRKLAATVSLVTTVEDGVRHGMPATAVSSLSMDPPSLLICVNRSASMHDPTSRSRAFCVNLLAHEQADLMRDFGGRASAERFGVGAWQTGRFGLPYLPDAAASLFCTVEHAHAYQTHTIFIGRVVEVHVEGAAQPLLYYAGVTGRFVPD